MSVDIKGTLQTYLAADQKSINITSAIGSVFGPAIGTVISNIFSGSIQVGGANFSFTGDQDSVTIVGTGQAAPLLSSLTVTFVFSVDGSGAQMHFTAAFTNSFSLAQAWPSQLNEAPFTNIVLTSGSLALDVNFGDSSFTLTITITGSNFESATMGTGLLEIQYSASLGFLAGVIVTGAWTPFADFAPLANLTFTEGGAFLSTIDTTDLSAFDPLKLAYTPDEIKPGLTFIAALDFGGDIADLSTFFPSGTTLNLLANIPLNNPSGTSIMADLEEPTTNSAWQFKSFVLEWDVASSIKLKVEADFRPDANDTLVLTGGGTFVYAPEENIALDVDVTLSGTGSWTHPFGVQNITIDFFSIGISLSEEGGFNFAVEGQITVGTSQTSSVILTLGAGIEDFEAPSFFLAELQPADKGTLVTIPQLVTDFIPSLDLSPFPFLNDISIGELELLVVAAPIELDNKAYSPGVGITGQIDFFGFDLDFAFSLTTSPSLAIQAQGTISENGGPIVISAAGVTIITISDSTGKLGATACIDTTGGTYCTTVTGCTGNYFNISAAVNILGLANASILAQASKDGFDFEFDFNSAVFTEKLGCTFYPGKGDFAALIDTEFNPITINFPGWGPIPSFSISTPSIALVAAFGTLVPTSPIGPQNYMPPSAPYFYFDMEFSWGIVDFSFSFEIDFGTIATAFQDFGSFLLNWLANNIGQVFKDILADALQLCKLLYQIGLDFFTVLDKLITQFVDMTIDALTDIVTSVFNAAGVCAVGTGSANMTPSLSDGMYHPVPAVLFDLTQSEEGQSLLYHYYVNKPEIDRLLQPGSPVRGRSHTILQNYVTSADRSSGRFVPVVVELLETTAGAGSADLKTSVAEALPLLRKFEGRTYEEFLAGLKPN